MENYKVYVEVTVKFSTDGVMMPVEFIWEDGTKYIIDKVKSKERCASRKAGGTGIIYTVLVDGKQSHFIINLISGLWSARVRKDLRKKTGAAEELTFPFCSFQVDI